MTVSYISTLKNTRMASVVTAAGATAYVQIWNGAIPATPGTAPAGTLLASCIMSNPIAGAAVNGLLTMNAIGNDPSANASGTPTFARIATNELGTTTGIAQMTAGVGSGDLNFDAAIVATGTVTITSLSITHG